MSLRRVFQQNCDRWPNAASRSLSWKPSGFVLAVVSTLVAIAGCGGKRQTPITIICPWATGGGTDAVSRFWADGLEQHLGRRAIVVNRTGGGGVTGHSAGARAKPDGSALTMITFELSTMHRMGMTKLTHEDFQPVMQVNADPAAIIVRAEAPWKDLRALLDAVRAEPKKWKMSGTSQGGAWDLARARMLLADNQPADAIVWVPNDGAAPSLQQLLGGHIDAVCCSVPEAAQSIGSGELRALAVLAEERLAAFPNVPTAKESGVDAVVVGWRGLAVPRDTPQEVVAQLEKACREIGESDEYREFMKKRGYEIKLRGADEFRKFLKEQDAMWETVVEEAGYGAAKS